VLRPLLVLAALALVGCTSDAPETAEKGDLAAIRADLAAHFAGDHPGEREAAAGECFAEELTERAGTERLRDGGVLDASYDVVAELPALPEDLAEVWAEAQFACTDFVEESTRAQEKATKGRIDPEEYAACLRAALTEDELRAAVVDSLTGDWAGPDLARLGRAQTDCAAEAAPAG
jgi:hypothetical protein